MSTKHGSLFLSVSISLLLFGGPAHAGVASSGRTYDTYPEWEFFPKGIDFEDEAECMAYQRLVDEGEAAHEAMLAIVRECDDPCIVSTALSVLRETTGDKRTVVGALRPLIAERLLQPEGDDEILDCMARAMADIGEEKDMPVLFPMLTHPCRRLRIIATRCLGKRGGKESIDVLEEVQRRDVDRLMQDETRQAIAAIEGRLAEKDEEEVPAP